jgi:gamma-glutamyl-gamma-aminobutyrate hydrolase PuuD
MSRPIIGITAGHQLPAAAATRPQAVLIASNADYARQVERAGGAPVLLPPVSDPETMKRLVGMLDGLLLSGGGDLNATLLDEEPHPRVGSIDPLRDAAEFVVINTAVDRALPILAICRGIQALNVALGGGLIQHIEDRGPSAICHQQHTYLPCVTHTIDIRPDTLMAEMLGEGRQWVNSHHHQAVGDLAPGFAATARSADNIIEAIEPVGKRPILGVQFHPEKLAETHRPFRAFFDWLVHEAGGD